MNNTQREEYDYLVEQMDNYGDEGVFGWEDMIDFATDTLNSQREDDLQFIKEIQEYMSKGNFQEVSELLESWEEELEKYTEK